MSEISYVGVRIQGGLLPGSLLPRLAGGKTAIASDAASTAAV